MPIRTDPRLTRLSARQQQIADLARSGASNVEIAGRLGVTLSTIRNTLTVVRKKLGATARQEQQLNRLQAMAGNKEDDVLDDEIFVDALLLGIYREQLSCLSLTNYVAIGFDEDEWCAWIPKSFDRPGIKRRHPAKTGRAALQMALRADAERFRALMLRRVENEKCHADPR